MGKIVNDTADYYLKLGVIRMYLGYYTNDDLVSMFQTNSLAEILSKYTYQQIRARLINTKTSTLDSDFTIGSLVEIQKPVLRNGAYRKNQGVIIGKHVVFDDRDRNRSPIYHNEYDILVQTDTYIDGYSYEIKRETARDLVLLSGHVSGVDSVMSQVASFAIDRPL